MGHVQKQHAGGIGIIRAEAARQPVSQIILWKHYPAYAREVFRFIFLHPKNLRGREAGEGNVGRVSGQLFLADGLVQVICLLLGPSVIPEDGRADDLIRLIQRHQTVHLASEADACHL